MSASFRCISVIRFSNAWGSAALIQVKPVSGPLFTINELLLARVAEETDRDFDYRFI